MKNLTTILSALLITSPGIAADVSSTIVCDVEKLNSGQYLGPIVLGSDKGKYITEARRAFDANNNSHVQILTRIEEEGRRVAVHIQKPFNNQFWQTVALASGGIETRLVLDNFEFDISVSCAKHATWEDSSH